MNNSVILSSGCPSGADAGALFVDRSQTSQHPVALVQSVRGATFNDPVLYGADAPDILLGAVVGSPVPSSDVAVNDARLLDVAPGNPGIQYMNCDFCLMKGGSVTATAGSTTSNLLQFAQCQPTPSPPCGPAFTDNLAATIGVSGTTMATENFTLFNYAHPFYALIAPDTGKTNSEIVLVKSGMGSPTWTIMRGQLGTTAASHNTVGASITIAQTSATDSPISNVDIGDLGVTDPAKAINNYVPGQGNDIEALQGVDWQATAVKIPGGGGQLDYLDEVPQISFVRNGSANTIASVGYKTTTPPFKTKCQRWYNTTSGNITVVNGQGIQNTGGGSYTLTSSGYGKWCFDPNLQLLYQLGGNAN